MEKACEFEERAGDSSLGRVLEWEKLANRVSTCYLGSEPFSLSQAGLLLYEIKAYGREVNVTPPVVSRFCISLDLNPLALSFHPLTESLVVLWFSRLNCPRLLS